MGVVVLGSIICISFFVVVCTFKLSMKFCFRRDDRLRQARSRRKVHARNDYFAVSGDFTNQSLYGLIEWNSIFQDNPYCVDVIDM